MTRFEELLGRLKSSLRTAGAPAATAAAAAGGAEIGTLIPAAVGLAMIAGVAIGVPRLIRWRYQTTSAALQVNHCRRQGFRL